MSRKRKKPSVVGLFSGCGGLDLGFKQAGFDILWANDFDQDSVKTYRENIGDHVVLGDITKIPNKDIPSDFDVLLGGFPCQGFSVANIKRSMKDERNFLYLEMLRVIKNIFVGMILISLCFSQQKIDFRTAEEQAKDPNVALKKSLIFPGVGQLYNDQKIKGYTLIAAELFSLYSFNENRKKYKDYNESYDKSQDYYLRERNRFAWIAIGLYFYGILDSVVEAHLDDFDKIVKENDPQSETGDIDGK